MGEDAWSYCVQLALCPHLRLVCMRRQIQECLFVLRKQPKGLTCALYTDLKGVKKVRSA